VRSEAKANLAEMLAFRDGRYSSRGMFHRATRHRIDGAEPVTLDGAPLPSGAQFLNVY